MAPLGLGLICRLALIVGVRQIIEGDRRRKVEERLSPGKEMVLDLLLVAKQAIRGAVECHVTQGTEVDPEKFAQRTGAAQPPVGRPFRARRRHAGGDGGQCAAPLPPVEAETVKQFRKAQHVQCCKRGMLDADRATVAVGGRGDVDILPVAVRGLAALTLHKPRCDPARLGLDPRIGWHKIEHHLTRQQFLDALAQERPVLAVDREVPPEIEQGVLAHLAVDAPALDQAEGDTGGAVRGGSGFGLANEHGTILRRGSRTIMALQTPDAK